MPPKLIPVYGSRNEWEDLVALLANTTSIAQVADEWARSGKNTRVTGETSPSPPMAPSRQRRFLRGATRELTAASQHQQTEIILPGGTAAVDNTGILGKGQERGGDRAYLAAVEELYGRGDVYHFAILGPRRHG